MKLTVSYEEPVHDEGSITMGILEYKNPIKETKEVQYDSDSQKHTVT